MTSYSHSELQDSIDIGTVYLDKVTEATAEATTEEEATAEEVTEDTAEEEATAEEATAAVTSQHVKIELHEDA